MRILLVDDDPRLCDSLGFTLKEEGFQVDVCSDSEDALPWIRQNAHDLILLDRMLPSMDGLQVLSAMRRENITTPVIFVTALGTLDDKVTGLDCGADDYIVKPFAFQELMARIRSIRRRPQTWSSSRIFSLGDITYDPEQNKLSTLPRNTLLMRVWGPDTDVEEGNLDNYVHFLRRRLKTVKSQLQITTVRGVGYCLQVFQ